MTEGLEEEIRQADRYVKFLELFGGEGGASNCGRGGATGWWTRSDWICEELVVGVRLMFSIVSCYYNNFTI